ncbi:MAG: hypothetical protein LBW77_02815, partial [Verrucomicrobiota bacterium]|nr:hypothetical protein [Verrucomicrobiota bacterium]
MFDCTPAQRATAATRTPGAGGASDGWWVRDAQGGCYGPVEFATLQAWARDGRIGPSDEISENGADWALAAARHELAMDWVAEVAPGRFYGPIHRDALSGLVASGAVAPQAPLFRRGGADEREPLPVSDELDLALARAAEHEEQWRLARQVAEARDVELEGMRLALDAQTQAAAERLKRERAVADEALRLERSRAAELAARAGRMEQERAEAVRQLERQAATFRLQRNEFRERVSALQSQADALQKQTAEFQKRTDERQRQLEAFEVETRALEAERQTLRAAVERAASEAEARAQRIAQLESAAEAA